jgi:hypothetical protein
MGKKHKKFRERDFLCALAEATLNKRPLPSHPARDGQIAIEKAGGVMEWIEQSLTRRLQFNEALRRLSWKRRRKNIVESPKRNKGLRSRRKGGGSIKPPPLSAGTPGNEETDPGPQRY